ncbi:MAG TPA: 6,7-dimethyl-8-ribityllumazine synthase [Candidatus Omnitrophota bacterium]|nr:6,7-dimethyl-8-ribityllumazine synthase [Candidatus Omnitrophota bacterium]HPB68872.1 6,7-dimethyl-8-ribityllumazine synthase [Candidatus Omnitrophota bacterium]HQO57970.1 6,7-dimethyl-8-ribityllumazine synthase [Candidatus Omnitrophota bacterium]HQP11813.1 6,7-dimethyl-8-ribityllumazine synthase [Candidatus Omnitrophota bacterium]
MAAKKNYVIIVSRFNEMITRRLLEGCEGQLLKRGIRKNAVRVVWVPGAFEIPVAALKAARKQSTAAVICLGAVVRGETYHFELVAQNAAKGILDVSLLTGKPVVFGVLTTETLDQAYKRSDVKGDHKGRDAADVAVDMVQTLVNI